jgi:hypothetical protein
MCHVVLTVVANTIRLIREATGLVDGGKEVA